jgi:TRAP-type mannitol/chloroaromatic compound transport system permease small subunit
VVFILPISLLITYYGFDFAYLAFEIGEKSGDPGGLYNGHPREGKGHREAHH